MKAVRRACTILCAMVLAMVAACGRGEQVAKAPAEQAKQGEDAVTAGPTSNGASSSSVAEFVAALDRISLVRAELLKGSAPEQIHLALFMDSDGKVSGSERPVLAGRFSALDPTSSPPANQNVLLLQIRLDADQARVFVVALVMKGDLEQGRLVDPLTGKETHLGAQGKINLMVTRNQAAAPSHPARLRVAQLWSLIGEKIDEPYQPAVFDAVVLGTKLVKTSVPTNFENPGQGSWVLLKTTSPDELYVALDVVGGAIEFFPKTPLQPNAAARALFRSL